MRHQIIGTCLLGTLLLAFTQAEDKAVPLSPSDGQSRPDKPNIIFIMVDDLGPEWVSCYGADDIETPAIDALAAGGMRFTNAYSMPKCTPTRATLLTGQYPFRHGWVNHWDVPRWGAGCHFDPKHNTTFARLLKNAGYTTCIAGKWQINDFRVQPDVLEQHGFDQWCMWTGFETGNKPSGQRYWNPYVHTRSGSKTYQDRFGADVFADFIIDFLKQNAAKPMMVYFPMALTHGPLVHTPAEPNVTEKYAKHKAMVRYTDLTVGRIVKALDELKIRERTIVVFTTDNGTSGGITGTLNGRSVKGGKGSIGENGCWEPFIVNCPGTVPHATTDCLTDFTDLLPTFCELGSAEIPADLKIDGHSIANVLLGRQKDGPREWIMAMGGGVGQLTSQGRVVPAKPYASRAIRDKRYKLWIDNQGQTVKVFDLQNDPGEQNNLLDDDDPAVAAARKKLEAAIATFPKQDGFPRYDRTPPQAWDRKLTASKTDKKAGGNKKREARKARLQKAVSAPKSNDSFPLKREWGEIRFVDLGLELHVTKRPKDGIVRLPRLNNRMKGVYLKGDPNRKPLKFKPEIQQWAITLPKSDNANPIVIFETIGEVYVPTQPRVVSQSKDRSIVLPAHDAVTHGKLLRYEPQPHKNTVGYWANEKDWCEWHFEVAEPGQFDVYILQGCGKGQGGSEVSVSIGDQSIEFVVEDTGHFQNFKDRKIGQLQIAKAGKHLLKVKPVKKAANAVMDVRQVKLVPAK